MIRFGEWTPDQPTYRGSATVARNVVPAAQSYRPLKEANPISDAADNYIRGIVAAQDSLQNYDLYAGTESKLLRFNTSTSALEDVSKSGGYTTSTENRWTFARYGERLVATNYDDNIQTLATASTGTFGDLVSFKARHVTVANEFLVTGYVNDTDGETPFRVRWSAIGDPTDFTVSTTTQSDFQDLPDGGAITGLVGGEELTILMERQVVRGTYAGLPLVWQFDTIDQQRGCAYRHAYANVGRLVYYLANDGFYVYDGNGSRPIGSERVNRWFFDNFEKSFFYRVTAAADPLNQVVVWSFPSPASDGTPDLVIIYNYAVNRWSYGELDLDTINSYFTAGYTLEQLNNVSSSIDALGASLDSSQWRGGQLAFGGAAGNKIVNFSGLNLDATLETPEFEAEQGRNSLVSEVHPYVEGNATIRPVVFSRRRLIDTPVQRGFATQNDAGWCPGRSEGRYHRIRLNITGGSGSLWDHAQGVAHITRPTGRR